VSRGIRGCVGCIVCQGRLKLSLKVDECKPLPEKRNANSSFWWLTTPKSSRRLSVSATVCCAGSSRIASEANDAVGRARRCTFTALRVMSDGGREATVGLGEGGEWMPGEGRDGRGEVGGEAACIVCVASACWSGPSRHVCLSVAAPATFRTLPVTSTWDIGV